MGCLVPLPQYPKERDCAYESRAASSLYKNLVGIDDRSLDDSGRMEPGARRRRGTGRPGRQSVEDLILKEFRWRSIGPATMGGRIDDIEAVESNPSIFYVAFATGGLWKTVNNGTTFEPIFDTYPISRSATSHLPGQSRHPLHRNRRTEQPAELVIRRRNLQIDRRRQNIRLHRPEGNAVHRPRRHRSERSERRIRRRGRPPFRPE